MYSLLFKMRAKLGLGIWGVQLHTKRQMFHISQGSKSVKILGQTCKRQMDFYITYHIWVWSWAGRGGCTLHRRRALLLFLPELHSYLHLLHQALIQRSCFHHHLQTLLIHSEPAFAEDPFPRWASALLCSVFSVAELRWEHIMLRIYLSVQFWDHI